MNISQVRQLGNAIYLDLTHTGLQRVSVEVFEVSPPRPMVLSDGFVVFELKVEVGDSGPVMYPIDNERVFNQQAALIVDQLQDDVMEYFRCVWPPCPGHSHPAVIVLADDALAWRCPNDGQEIALLGALFT